MDSLLWRRAQIQGESNVLPTPDSHAANVPVGVSSRQVSSTAPSPQLSQTVDDVSL